MDNTGIYISVPFCRAKCSFCNFASGVWDAGDMQGYIDRVRAEIGEASDHASRLGVIIPERVDTVYFGGGTPSLLPSELVAELMSTLRTHFLLNVDAEFTVECAPGQWNEEALGTWLQQGLNRVSLGVQSFVDRESAAVGRLHTAAMCRDEIVRLKAAGIEKLGVDLICGLPHQTMQSWQVSVEETLQSGVEHVSIYMLEVDDGSRLGREALAGGGRYGAASLPSDDEVAEMYSCACEWLETSGMPQYEISNFGQPYLGFGLDAHSMLRDGAGGVRWANPDDMGEYLGTAFGARGWPRSVERVGRIAAFEEELFLGLRRVDGVCLDELAREYGELLAATRWEELAEAGLLEQLQSRIRLTPRGRMASNEVFERLLVDSSA